MMIHVRSMGVNGVTFGRLTVLHLHSRGKGLAWWGGAAWPSTAQVQAWGQQRGRLMRVAQHWLSFGRAAAWAACDYVALEARVTPLSMLHGGEQVKAHNTWDFAVCGRGGAGGTVGPGMCGRLGTGNKCMKYGGNCTGEFLYCAVSRYNT